VISGEIKGLVLAGGKSLRMGIDKGAINWHGLQQRYHIADILSNYCDEVFISCRDEEQAAEITNNYKVLTDTHLGFAALGAILTALESNPAKAWLVVACDLPLVDNETIEYLLAKRDLNAIATTYQSPHDDLPEPLITIWEASSIDVLKTIMAENIKCPRKALLRNIDKVRILQPTNSDALINANTPEDAERVKQIIEHRRYAV
jgi:molybdenum cofactor guanylyltransferase